jgi:hypothetical protein
MSYEIFSEEFAERVVRGDASTVDEFRETYDQASDTDVLSFACLLYTFKYRSNNSEELVRLTPRLLQVAERFPSEPQDDDVEAWVAQADMLTTYLSWLARSGAVMDVYPLVGNVLTICEDVERFVNDSSRVHGNVNHNILLLELTHIAMQLWVGKRENTKPDGDKLFKMLRVCVADAAHVTDSDQHARILRKAGMLYRQMGMYHWLTGCVIGMRAFAVPKSSLLTRMKSVAALVGFRG